MEREIVKNQPTQERVVKRTISPSDSDAVAEDIKRHIEKVRTEEVKQEIPAAPVVRNEGIPTERFVDSGAPHKYSIKYECLHESPGYTSLQTFRGYGRSLPE